MNKDYIYESPDNGDTVYRREMGSSEKELISVKETTMGTSYNYSDLHDDTLDTIDISSITLPDNPVAGTITISDNYNKDVTMEIDGKQRSMRELFSTVDTIKERLAILEPKKHLLDKYELLQSLYEQYKAAEAMLYEDEDEEEELPF